MRLAMAGCIFFNPNRALGQAVIKILPLNGLMMFWGELPNDRLGVKAG